MKNFFKGISFSSIFAGALAAVTSFLLSAKIGIAGSVIGVAAGSIVSAVATQVYKNVLKASGEKLQSAVPFVANDKNEGEGEEAKDKNENAGNKTTVIAPAQSEGERTTLLSAGDGDETTTMTATSGRIISSVQAEGRESHMLPDNSTGKRRTSFNAWLHGKYAPIVIAIVSALVGVAVSAGLILAFTGGHGTDTVVRDVVNNSKQTPSYGNDDDATYGNNDYGNGIQNGTMDTDKDSAKSNKNSGKDTGKKTDSSTDGTDSSTNGSDSSTNSSTGNSGKTDTSTDSNQSSNGSPTPDNSGQNDGTTTTPNGSTDTNPDSSSTGSQSSNGTSSGTSSGTSNGTSATN